jgi:hypothetical protein
MASNSSGVDCVFLSCFAHKVLFFASVLGQGSIRVHHADTVEMADLLLLATGATVLLADTTFLVCRPRGPRVYRKRPGTRSIRGANESMSVEVTSTPLLDSVWKR